MYGEVLRIVRQNIHNQWFRMITNRANKVFLLGYNYVLSTYFIHKCYIYLIKIYFKGGTSEDYYLT